MTFQMAGQVWGRETLVKTAHSYLALCFPLHLSTTTYLALLIKPKPTRKTLYIKTLPRIKYRNMASDSKDSAFNILGSSKLNTADGKNPTSSATTSTSTQPGTASGQKNSEEYRLECSKAHDALEDRLRDEVSLFSLGFLSEYETCKMWSGAAVHLRPPLHIKIYL